MTTNKPINAGEVDGINWQATHVQIKFKNEVSKVIDALADKGIRIDKFYPDTIDRIKELCQQGADVYDYMAAYKISLQFTQGRGFTIGYLLKIVEGLTNTHHIIKKCMTE